MPKWNTVSISGYHFREKGCSAVQEVAFTLANGIAYVQAALDAGLEIDRFAPRLAFFFNGHNNVFQEVAKFRAARRMWAAIMRERFGAQDERSWRLRFHTQTGGVTLTAQQPENNIVRVALQGFAAVCGGTQSLHTNGFDEALALPTERAAKIALRTQQIIGYESGAADTVDPFAGSYFVEALTDEIERRAQELIDKVDELGGSVQAIDFIKNEIEESAFGYHERYRIEQDIVVGVNKFVEDTPEVPDILRVDPESEREQVARLQSVQGRPRRGAGGAAPRGDPRVRPRDRQHAAGAAPGAQGPLLDRRGVRGDARRVRRLQAELLMALATVAFPQVVLAIHILAVVIAFGGVFAFPLMFGAAVRTDPRSSRGCCARASRSGATSSIPACSSSSSPASTWPPRSTSGAASTSAGASSPPSSSARSRDRSSSGRPGGSPSLPSATSPQPQSPPAAGARAPRGARSTGRCCGASRSPATRWSPSWW